MHRQGQYIQITLARTENVLMTIPGAEMIVIDGMSHDDPYSAVPQIAEAILEKSKRTRP